MLLFGARGLADCGIAFEVFARGDIVSPIPANSDAGWNGSKGKPFGSGDRCTEVVPFEGITKGRGTANNRATTYSRATTPNVGRECDDTSDDTTSTTSTTTSTTSTTTDLGF